MSEKMTWDPHCYECKVRYRDPKAKDLVMYLHAWRYKVRITDPLKDHRSIRGSYIYQGITNLLKDHKFCLSVVAPSYDDTM